MNLHGIVANQVSAVNPLMKLSIQTSSGYTQLPNGQQVPTYNPAVVILGQVQSLSAGEIQHMDALNIQGIRRAIYLSGEIDGLIRETRQGGDLITTPNGQVWLVHVIDEYWEDWVKALVTLQNNS